MTPFGVDIIAIPRPLFIFGKLCALEKTLLPGFDTLSITLITGDPELYFKSIINNGLGIAIVSTPKGVMTDIDARKQRVGGEIICKVF